MVYWSVLRHELGLVFDVRVVSASSLLVRDRLDYDCCVHLTRLSPGMLSIRTLARKLKEIAWRKAQPTMERQYHVRRVFPDLD